MTEPGTRSPQVVWREFGNSQPFRVFLHNVPDHLLRDCRSPDDTFSTNASENLAVRNTSYGQLVVNVSRRKARRNFFQRSAASWII